MDDKEKTDKAIESAVVDARTKQAEGVKEIKPMEITPTTDELSDVEQAKLDVETINERLIQVRTLEPKRDIFFVQHARPERIYYHAEDTPLRIREMELKGYVVCTGKELVGSPLGIKEPADGRQKNLPRHVLMWTSRENHARLDREKDARLARHEEDIKDAVDNVKKVLERSGLGRATGKLTDDELKF